MEDTQQSNGEGSDRDVLTPHRWGGPLRTAVPSRMQDSLRVRPAPLLYCGVLRDGGGDGVTLRDGNGIQGLPRRSETIACSARDDGGIRDGDARGRARGGRPQTCAQADLH